jgi:anthraniloyl-CoA monooxygenase
VWRRAGLDEMSQEEGIRFLRTAVRGAARWPSAPVERDAPSRLGDVDPLSADRLCALGAPDRRRRPAAADRADGRCGAHGALLDRLGDQAALEDAIELARCFATHSAEGIDRVLSVYEELRSIEVLKIQSAARNSMEWFENVDRYTAFEAEQFAYSMLTRSQRIPHENLRLRDARYVAGYEDFIAAHAYEQAGVPMPKLTRPIPPMLTPFARAASCSRTGSSSRRWRSTRPTTAFRATITSCISARERWAGRAWYARK